MIEVLLERARSINASQLSKDDQYTLEQLIKLAERLDRESRILDVIQFALERRWK